MNMNHFHQYGLRKYFPVAAVPPMSEITKCLSPIFDMGYKNITSCGCGSNGYSNVKVLIWTLFWKNILFNLIEILLSNKKRLHELSFI